MAYRYRSDGLLVGDLNDDKYITGWDLMGLNACIAGVSDCYNMHGKRETQFDPLGG